MSRRDQVKDIFAAALELEDGARANFLREACADTETHREVVSMLEAYRAAGSFLEESPLASRRSFLETSLEGRVIASYRIDRMLGEGGMGRVYLASRADGAYRKQVAIKTIRGPWANEEASLRFLNERQILADLEHPCIAKLLDGGQTEDGLLYIIMEYVDGEPIDVYCERRNLTIRRRLELFRGVCDAVFFAHRSLVVHRDLKPGNIMVTGEGVPKLLDFGIAKWLDPQVTVEGGMTSTSARPMTLAYASPEQVRGEPITTATDVHALGVVLYELLTGLKPYRSSRPTGAWQADELARLICEQEPEKPSSVVQRAHDGDPSKLRRRLVGDLDTLVLKAMSKDPARRYASVEGLSEDIRRHLEELPIRARRETLAYRFGKFVRRSPLLALTLALITLLVFGLVLLTLEVTQQRDLAELEKQTALEIADFTLDLFKESDPAESRGEEPSLREFLERAAITIQSDLADRPRVRATMMDMIGTMFYRLGRYDQARQHLEEALALRRVVLAAGSPEVADSLDVLAQLYSAVDEPRRAIPLCREAIAIRRQLEDPEALARSLNNHGLFLAALGQLDAATASIEEALDLLRGIRLGNDPEVATVLSSLASILHARGRLEEAMPLLRRALEIHRAMSGADHPKVPLHVHNLGRLILESGRFAEAEPLLEEAAAEARRLLGGEHPHTLILCNSFGDLLRRRGRSADARRVLEDCLQKGLETLGAQDSDVLLNTGNLVAVLIDQGRLEAARTRLAVALEVTRIRDDLRPGQIARLQHLEGRLWLAQGQTEAAEVHLRQALTLRQDVLREDHPAIASTLIDLARAVEERPAGDLSTAEALFRRAMDIQSRALPDGHPDRAPALLGLSRLLHRRGEAEAAAPLILRARELIVGELVAESGLVVEADRLWRENRGLR